MTDFENEETVPRQEPGTMELRRTYRFEAAHFLPRVAAGHPCGKMHGHSYVIEVAVRGHVVRAVGWVIDFAAIDDVMAPLITRLDHSVLNETIDNPTSEMVAVWFWRGLRQALGSRLYEVVVRETARSSCTYRGPQA